MFKARVNTKYNFAINGDTDKEVDMIQISHNLFHLIKNNTSYTAEVLNVNRQEKNFIIRVNGNKYTVGLKDKYDDLLKELGIDNTAAIKVKEMKAPMPGLVVEVRVSEGDLVKKGDPLLVLQAMKMENILKSPGETIIKKIHVKKDNTVEKNQLLISFT
jgi:acetyl/propionyl-CoA carboxylase alpha subunit